MLSNPHVNSRQPASNKSATLIHKPISQVRDSHFINPCRMAKKRIAQNRKPEEYKASSFLSFLNFSLTLGSYEGRKP